MGFLEIYLAIKIISQMCWLFLWLYCLLSLAAISVPPLLTLLCCWGYWRLPLGVPLLPPHLLQLPENCLFQDFTVEPGTLPCRARGCLHSWSSARWVCPCLTSPVRCCRDGLVFLHSTGLVFRLVLAQPQQVSPAGTFWQRCRCVEVVHTTKSSLLSLSVRGWEADILAAVRHSYTSSCTCPLASTESEIAAATAKNAHFSFQETAITITNHQAMHICLVWTHHAGMYHLTGGAYTT